MALYNLKNPYDCQRFKEMANKLVKEQACVEMKKKFPARSLSQNAYLHVLLGYFASEFGYTLEEVKYEYFKKTCNPDLFIRERVNKRGITVKYVRSSAELDTKDMTIAIERFRNWCMAENSFYLPSPNEGEALFFAQQQMEQYQEYL